MTLESRQALPTLDSITKRLSQRPQEGEGQHFQRADSKPSKTAVTVSPDTAIEEAGREPDVLIGLPQVKDEVRRLKDFLALQKEREKVGLRTSVQTLHFVFTGNPGTGKTSVARIVSKFLYGFEILKTPKVVECDRSNLVGGYLGQTAIN